MIDYNTIHSINLAADVAHRNAVAKGFWDDVDIDNLDVVGNKLMLIVGEVAEAHEEIRKGVDPRETYYPGKPTGGIISRTLKPEGLPSELADVVIRVFDLAGALNIDLGESIARKMEYNATRPHKHGKKF